LPSPALLMPGCRGRGRRFRHTASEEAQTIKPFGDKALPREKKEGKNMPRGDGKGPRGGGQGRGMGSCGNQGVGGRCGQKGGQGTGAGQGRRRSSGQGSGRNK
jgi:hypothetical protein